MNFSLPSSEDIRGASNIPTNSRGLLSPRQPRVNLHSEQRIKSPSPPPYRPSSFSRPSVSVMSNPTVPNIRYRQPSSIATMDGGLKRDGMTVGMMSPAGVPVSSISSPPNPIDSIPDSNQSAPMLERGLSGSAAPTPKKEEPPSMITSVPSKGDTPVAVIPTSPIAKPSPVIDNYPEDKRESVSRKENVNREETKPKPKQEPKPKQTPKPKPKQTSKPHSYVRASRRPIPDYSTMDTEEQARRWADFESRFNTLKEHFPEGFELTMPDRNSETLNEVHARYNQFVENIYREKFLSEEADKNRLFLVLFWAAIEIVLILIGVNANGYTALQISLASQYDILLIELGEEKWNTSGGGGGNSPIYDMVVSSLITLGIFLFIKFVTSMLGEETSNSISTYIIGEMVRKKKERGGSSTLVGVRDVLDLLGTFKENLASGQGMGMENVMGMFGNLLGNLNL